MAYYRFRIDKRSGYNIVHLRYGQGCQCSWLKMELRVPKDRNENEYIKGVLNNL